MKTIKVINHKFISRVQAWYMLRFKRKQEMTVIMSLFIQQVKFIYLLIISTVLWVGVVALYWVALAGDWREKPALDDLKDSMPYVLASFEMITSVGFAVVFYWLYRELKLLPDKTFERIKYKTMTYLTLITMLTNTRFLYNIVLMINNSLTNGSEKDFNEEKLEPSYVSELIQCLFVMWHIFS